MKYQNVIIQHSVADSVSYGRSYITWGYSWFLLLHQFVQKTNVYNNYQVMSKLATAQVMR